jgi:isoprenylcysteine carboxyl methyltransferase (ICMT) family protein YpbQ
VRHPNYIAVIGELLGFAVMVGAPGTGIPSILLFARLIQLRVGVEERALRGT